LRILVDTSVWVDFLNGFHSLEERALGKLIAGDCLIAVLAEENACDVLTRDRDLDSILASGLVKTRAFGHS
jgi:predicted nucleic acid-binding protein